MQVRELVALLLLLPQDFPVYVSSDEEGNEITRLDRPLVEILEDPTDWRTDVADDEWGGTVPNAVVLWP